MELYQPLCIFHILFQHIAQIFPKILKVQIIPGEIGAGWIDLLLDPVCDVIQIRIAFPVNGIGLEQIFNLFQF